MMPRSLLRSSCGASFSEVLVAMAIVPIGLIGAMGAFHASEHTIERGTLANRALAMAEARIEAKRAARWDLLLVDDLDHDGIPEVMMRDDGQGGDLSAGDGMYSARREQDGVVLTWMVMPNHNGSLSSSGYVILTAWAEYGRGERRKELRIATVRSNPTFVGP